MLRAVFFDLNGTLVDISAWKSDEAFSYDLEILHSLGCTITLQQCKKEFEKARQEVNELYKGSTKRHQTGLIFSTVCKNLGLKIDPKIALETDYKVLNELLKKTNLVKGATETLRWVKEKGMKMALICNGSIIRINMLIDRFGLRKFFDCIVISEEVGYEKSTGVPFKTALRRLSLLPEQAVMVGEDPFEDIEGARKAGLKTILLSDGKASHSADFEIKSLEELPKVLSRMR